MIRFSRHWCRTDASQNIKKSAPRREANVHCTDWPHVKVETLPTLHSASETEDEDEDEDDDDVYYVEPLLVDGLGRATRDDLNTQVQLAVIRIVCSDNMDRLQAMVQLIQDFGRCYL